MENLGTHLRNIWDLALKNLEQAQIGQKRQFDKKRKPLTLAIGDHVWRKEKTPALGKLSCSYTGPYCVHQLLPRGAVMLQLVGREGMGEIIVNPQWLSLCKEEIDTTQPRPIGSQDPNFCQQNRKTAPQPLPPNPQVSHIVPSFPTPNSEDSSILSYTNTTLGSNPEASFPTLSGLVCTGTLNLQGNQYSITLNGNDLTLDNFIPCTSKVIGVVKKIPRLA